MMKKKKPLHAKGYRNVFCPHYRICLDHASRKYWEYWTCLDCHYKHEQKSLTHVFISPENQNSYYLLPPSLNEKLNNF